MISALFPANKILLFAAIFFIIFVVAVASLSCFWLNCHARLGLLFVHATSYLPVKSKQVNRNLAQFHCLSQKDSSVFIFVRVILCMFSFCVSRKEGSKNVLLLSVF